MDAPATNPRPVDRAGLCYKVHPMALLTRLAPVLALACLALAAPGCKNKNYPSCKKDKQEPQPRISSDLESGALIHPAYN